MAGSAHWIFDPQSTYRSRLLELRGVSHRNGWETRRATPRICPGMPANTMNLASYTRFLLECVQDERFTLDRILDAIDQAGGTSDCNDRSIGVLLYRKQN